MSRIGRLPFTVPSGVTVSVTDNEVVVKGPKGELKQDYNPLVAISVEDGVGTVTRKNESKAAKSFHGLYRRLIENMIVGVSNGYAIGLQINGVGYRAEVKGNIVTLNLGFSNQVEYVVREGVEVAAEGPNKLVVKGIDKAKVGQVAAEIRSIRPPEPYKGKGVKYETETIRRKVGKSGVK
ncbi:50S ribosomal protein L6 [Spirochaeta africana]|uniref:Large ribosomal subunit protein uL6 n=1 Tax=Spirochaeta africana (strain ATCC 700263 / DSM 8902 / Z-7692) TaxID=889378 RepID=H9UGM7_SPIAZ|nr:50S ribosomal protein L6 [Spirochaeta africana]AFG36670.1 ribosomal protein L6, bacterial type [Spirochaeta africana DSM 8902]